MSSGHGRPPPKKVVNGEEEEEEEEDMYEIVVEKSGCKEEHFALLDCMDERNRDWRLCQDYVKALRDCVASQQQKKQPK
eukprot:m.270674 g.270674  ORF g.270674 m.270674 type:complete len:79 (-) comp15682_c0_seq13:2980-3216(-)